MACRCATVPPPLPRLALPLFLILFFFPSPPRLPSRALAGKTELSLFLGPPLSTLHALSTSSSRLSPTFLLGRPRLALVAPDRRVPVPQRRGQERRLSLSLSPRPGLETRSARRHGFPPAPLPLLLLFPLPLSRSVVSPFSFVSLAALVATGRLIYDQLIWIN